ncbi:hypothetical protein LCGC14_2424270 [marine sediment metagenome]|uniref:Uncharacterized protein n=1 Tax=marine sediment metagenome TaxID=412755 RepID=A0A0F9BNW2_9ZZZZ
MMSPDLAWRLLCNAQHRRIMAEFRTARHDRAIMAQALQFLLLKQQPVGIQAYEPGTVERLIGKLDSVALQEIEPEGGGS